MSAYRFFSLLTLFASLAGCGSSPLFDAPPPKQQARDNPLAARGKKSFEQRKRDCWDMPSARSCYEVGMNYELGLSEERNKATALKYYEKACQLEKLPEHCAAARRMRKD